MEVPVEKNKDYIIDITATGSKGEGIGRIEGFAVFVPGALKGEKAEIKIVKVKKNYAYGKLLKVLRSSPGRVEPFCGVYKYCGGCNLQHMSYDEQLRFKKERVAESIEKIGKVKGTVIHDIIGMTVPFGYRNKMQYPAGTAGGTAVIGFYSERSHRIVDVPECGIQHEAGNAAVDIVRRLVREKRIPVYDETTRQGILRHIAVRVGYKTGEVMVIIVTNGRELPHRQEIVETLKAGIPGLKTVIQNINSRDTNIIFGGENVVLHGQGSITDYIGKFRFNISPLSFFQVNPVQTEVLYEKALEYAGLKGGETVFDLYCGIGTISLFLSQKAGKVYGVESVPGAIEDAKENARLNGVENVEFIAGEAEKAVPELYKKGIRADVAIVDPPRKGCDEALLKVLVEMRPERIVYVSCNPATLARDLGYLQGKGYKVAEVQPVDMFPWTSHVECVTLMSRVEK